MAGGLSSLLRRLVAATRIRKDGCSSRAGGSTRFITRKNPSVTTVSDSAAASTRSVYQFDNRIGIERRPGTCGKARSAPTAIRQAVRTGFAAARKNRRLKSASPRSRQSRNATASSAATDIPCP